MVVTAGAERCTGWLTRVTTTNCRDAKVQNYLGVRLPKPGKNSKFSKSDSHLRMHFQRLRAKKKKKKKSSKIIASFCNNFPLPYKCISSSGIFL